MQHAERRPAEREGRVVRTLLESDYLLGVAEVASVTATWRDTAKAVDVRAAEINRMASAFEHDDLKRALAP